MTPSPQKTKHKSVEWWAAIATIVALFVAILAWVWPNFRTSEQPPDNTSKDESTISIEGDVNGPVVQGDDVTVIINPTLPPIVSPSLTPTTTPYPTTTPFPTPHIVGGMAEIPGGTFIRGSSEEEISLFASYCDDVANLTGAIPCTVASFRDETPRSQIYLDTFWIDVYLSRL